GVVAGGVVHEGSCVALVGVHYTRFISGLFVLYACFLRVARGSRLPRPGSIAARRPSTGVVADARLDLLRDGAARRSARSQARGAAERSHVRQPTPRAHPTPELTGTWTVCGRALRPGKG